MELKIKDEPERRKPHSFYLRATDVQVLKDLADRHNTTASKVLESLIDGFGRKILATIDGPKSND